MRDAAAGAAHDRQRAPVTSRAIWAIGFGQLVNWGVLYYAFGVLLVPLERALAAPRWLVAGAFSVGLLVSAVAAPAAGRLADRGQGPVVMQAGGFIAAGLLIVWGLVPSIWITYIVWAGLGLCMATILYEPVFAIVGRAFGDAGSRLRAIATVTVMGGLASTAFLPGTSMLVDRAGWRGAVFALAAVIAVTTMVVSRIAFREHAWSSDEIRVALLGTGRAATAHDPLPGLSRLVTTFSLSSIVNSALASNIVAALIERQLSPSRAAVIGGLFGVMQLPGRLLMTRASFMPSPFALLLASFGLQVVGLAALMAEGCQAAMWTGVTVFACGAGLTTLARPYLVLQAYGAGRAGAANGAIARGQQLARAVGPVSAAALAEGTGYRSVFGLLAILVLASLVIAWPQTRIGK
jgi:MFS family permease